jgi:hypothetical protein
MAHENAGNYGAKHGSESRLNKEIAQAVEKRAVKGEIACANAFIVASELHVPPSEVGMSIDLMEIRIGKCQQGLFGYGDKKLIVEPAKTVSSELETAIRDALVNGRLPCALAWEIAEKFDIPKLNVSSACEALKIKIKPCQLGAF